MPNGLTDPNAGRYSGNDAAARRPFRELQRAMQHLREDPVVKITALTPVVGTYRGVPVAGRTTADGVTTGLQHWGMRTELTNRAYLVINTLESPTNSASAIALGTVLLGSRRMNANGEDSVFVSYPVSSATSGTDLIDTDPDGQGGGPGTTPGGIPPDPTGGTGGGPDPTGGGGPIGGGPDGSCPIEKVVVLAGCTNPSDDGHYLLRCDPGGSVWSYGPGGVVTISYSAFSSAWVVSGTIGDRPYLLSSTATCPPSGVYTNGVNSSTATVS